MNLQLRSRAPQLLVSLQRSLRGRSAFLFGGLMLANAVAYVYHLLMARLMTPADYGALVTLTSISYVLMVLMRTIQAWVIKMVSASQEASSGHVRAVFGGAMRTLVPLGAAVFLGHWLVSGWVADFLNLDTPTPIIVLGLYTFSSFLMPVPRGALLGLNRLHFASVVSVLEAVARVATGLVLVSWGLRVNGAVMGYALGNFVSFFIALVPLWPLLRRQSEPEPRVVNFSGLDRYLILVLVINTCLMTMSSVDQIAVKHYFSEQVAGNYGVAFLLGRVITLSTTAMGWVIFARSVAMPPDSAARARLLKKALAVTGAITLTLTAGYLTAPALAVWVMGGSQYRFADTYVGLVAIENALFAFVYTQAYYQMALKKMQVIWPLSLATLLEIVLLSQYHATVQQVLWTLISVMGGLLLCVSGISWWILRGDRQPVPSVVSGGPASMAEVE